MEKDYGQWHEFKSDVNRKTEIPYFAEREVWYCSVGINVGHEQDGKNNQFERPIIILKKLNVWTFFGIPMTSKMKHGSFYVSFSHNQQSYTAIIGQMRLFDSKRLNRKCFKLSDEEFEKIRIAMKLLL